MMDKRSSNKTAPLLIVAGLLCFIAGYGANKHNSATAESLALGGIIALLLITWIAVRSYKGTKKGLTERQIQNVRRTGKSARLWPLWYAIGFVLYFVARGTKFANSFGASPFVEGAFGGLCLFIGILVLLDNYWMHAIFVWNIPDKRVASAWRRK